MSFTELIEAYQEKGIRGLNEACKKKKEKVEEEVDNETFTKELKDQIASMEGKKKQPPVAAAATQGVKSMDEEVEELDELNKSTLRSYVNKAEDDKEEHEDNVMYTPMGAPKHLTDIANKSLHKIKQREKGITIANHKLLKKEEVEELDERSLSQSESEKKEKYVKGMKKNLKGFKERYGERAKDVAYATATKMAKED